MTQRKMNPLVNVAGHQKAPDPLDMLATIDRDDDLEVIHEAPWETHLILMDLCF